MNYENMYYEELERQSRESSERFHEREKRRKAQREEWEHARLYAADNWHQALRKNAARMYREIEQFPDCDDNDWWKRQADASIFAADALQEEEAFIEPIIAALERKIEKLKLRAIRRAYLRTAEQYGDDAPDIMIDGSDPEDLLWW